MKSITEILCGMQILLEVNFDLQIRKTPRETLPIGKSIRCTWMSPSAGFQSPRW